MVQTKHLQACQIIIVKEIRFNNNKKGSLKLEEDKLFSKIDNRIVMWININYQEIILESEVDEKLSLNLISKNYFYINF
jgi:hypothetical protein